MRVLLRSPRSGKTTALVLWLQNEPPLEHRLLVTFSRNEADRLKKEYSKIKERFLCWREATFTNAIKAMTPRGKQVILALDNADIILSHLFLSPIAIATFTQEITPR